MSRTKNILWSGILLFVVSCTCSTPMQVTPIQKSDKDLTCKDVILEINESEHYRSQAAKERAISPHEALMPVCWMSSFIDAERAEKAANDRIKYLGQIYELLNCSGNYDDVSSNTDIPESNFPIPAIAVPVRPTIPPATITPPPTMPQDTNTTLSNNHKNRKNHYKLERIPGGGENIHEHTDKQGKTYVHKHSHRGAHRHIEDE